jgi:hypothetical protein
VSRPSFAALLIETGRLLGEQILQMGLMRMHSQAYRTLQRQAPRDPWLSRRLWKAWPTDRGTTIVDTISTRAAHLPPRGLAGVTARRILVYHEADKAGKHIECYLEVNGTAYNVGVKRLDGARLAALDLRKNHEGRLTEASQDRLLALWRSEFQVGRTAWLAQSTDHTPTEARWSWSRPEQSPQGYGKGPLRMVLADDPVALSTLGESVEWRDPLLDRQQDAFAFRVMTEGGKNRPSNILGVGLKKTPPPPSFEKLHLKFLKDPEKFLKRVDGGLITVKEDGASFFFRIDKHGARFWSPRVSKTSRSQIDYTAKFRDWRTVTHPEVLEGMGEFLVTDAKGQVLSSAAIGGLLNSNAPIPADLRLKAVLYRLDKVGRTDVKGEAYEAQYQRLARLAEAHGDWSPPRQVVPDLATIQQIAASEEGCVGVPAGHSIIEAGCKLKTRGDTFDWQVERVDLQPGERGGIAGVVWFRSLESGREFKVGGGPLGTEVLRTEMMRSPEAYVGRVYKIACFRGHEGRAAHVLTEHADKGLA